MSADHLSFSSSFSSFSSFSFSLCLFYCLCVISVDSVWVFFFGFACVSFCLERCVCACVIECEEAHQCILVLFCLCAVACCVHASSLYFPTYICLPILRLPFSSFVAVVVARCRVCGCVRCRSSTRYVLRVCVYSILPALLLCLLFCFCYRDALRDCGGGLVLHCTVA